MKTQAEQGHEDMWRITKTSRHTEDHKDMKTHAEQQGHEDMWRITKTSRHMEDHKDMKTHGSQELERHTEY
jgi:hypothetical protein